MHHVSRPVLTRSSPPCSTLCSRRPQETRGSARTCARWTKAPLCRTRVCFTKLYDAVVLKHRLARERSVRGVANAFAHLFFHELGVRVFVAILVAARIEPFFNLGYVEDDDALVVRPAVWISVDALVDERVVRGSRAEEGACEEEKRARTIVLTPSMMFSVLQFRISPPSKKSKSDLIGSFFVKCAYSNIILNLAFF